MTFNSLSFAIFLPVVFLLYWALHGRSLKIQNTFVLAASYLFYGWWDYRFLGLIFISSVVDFVIGLKLDSESDPKRRKTLLYSSLEINLGFLGFFKYYNFFSGSFEHLLHSMGLHADFVTLNLVLPVGISFYTFQTLSYTIDIYRGQLKPTRDAIAFFAFVSFFPQLVAGPIERARNLLPQFLSERQFEPDKARDGMRQILWGLFKKVVVADNIGPQIHFIFSNYESLDAATLFMGAAMFTMQIYCDFSGYSDIAIGTARLFGFNLMQNFAFPFFARNLVEHWRRWHISLSTWFRDYIYFPMGGSRVPAWRRNLNIITTFTISGLWHGANWHFVIWGFLHGLFLAISQTVVTPTQYKDVTAQNRILPNFSELWRMLAVCSVAWLTAIFFRSDTLLDSLLYLGRIVTLQGYHILPGLFYPLGLSAIVIAMEWINRRRQHGLEISYLPIAVRWMTYLVYVFMFLLLGNFHVVEFIYFQF